MLARVLKSCYVACRNQLCQGQCGGFCGGCCLEDNMSHVPGPNQGQETNLFNLSVVDRTAFECAIGHHSGVKYTCDEGKCAQSSDGTGISLSECSKVTIDAAPYTPICSKTESCCKFHCRCASHCHYIHAILPVYSRCASKRTIQGCLECHWKSASVLAAREVCRMREHPRSTVRQS